MRKALVALALTVVAVLGTATPALAHNVLISSDPANGSSVAAGPQKVSLTFDQYVQGADVNQIAVTGPGGGQWAEGPISVVNNVITAPLRPLGPAGKYTIGYRVLSADGHPVTGELTFTLTAAGTGTPATVDAAKSPGSSSSAAPQSGVDRGADLGLDRRRGRAAGDRADRGPAFGPVGGREELER